MELEKRSLGREMSECKKENRKLNKKLKPVKKECEMIQSMIAEVSSLDVIDVDNEQVCVCGVVLYELPGQRKSVFRVSQPGPPQKMARGFKF